MPPRAIVRDPDFLEGRWRIDGTLIFVADVQRDFRAQRGNMRAPYQNMGLTEAEIDAALTFAFPAVVARELTVEGASLKTRCECGERRRTQITSPNFETDACICGRLLRVQVDLDAALRNGHGPSTVTGGQK